MKVRDDFLVPAMCGHLLSWHAVTTDMISNIPCAYCGKNGEMVAAPGHQTTIALKAMEARCKR